METQEDTGDCKTRTRTDQNNVGKNGCRTNTALLLSKNHTTSVKNKHLDDQNPDINEVILEIDATSGSDKESRLKYEHYDKPKRSKRPTRSETRPPSNHECHRSTTPPSAAAWQLLAAKTNVIPNRQDRDGSTNQTRQARDGEPEKPERPERSESPKNLSVSAHPNLREEHQSTGIQQLLTSARMATSRYDHGDTSRNRHDPEEHKEISITQCSGRKGARGGERVYQHKELGMYLWMNQMGPSKGAINSLSMLLASKEIAP